MNKNILLCGVGGQGTVLASKLLASAAMEKNLHVLTAETIGMAQRGGSVTGHVRIGDELYSPLITCGQADVIIGFEPGEAVRMLPYLKEGGLVVTSIRPVRPVTGTLGGTEYTGREMIEYMLAKNVNLVTVDGTQAMNDLGSAKVLNMVLLGAAVKKADLGLTKEDIREAIIRKVPQKFHKINLEAIDYYKG